jgi:Cu-processing system permease protein
MALLTAIGVIAAKEFRDSLRTRWFWLYTFAFAALASALAYLAASFSGLAGVRGFGRTAAGLVNLVLLIVPLMGLTAGAQAIAGERERGTLLYLLSQPLDRAEIFFGKWLGLAAALALSVLTAFGLTGLLLAVRGSPLEGGGYLRFALLTVLLALSSLGLGLAISAVSDRMAAATGAALFAWLGLVFLGDLGLMGMAAVLRLGIRPLALLSALNPLQLFKVAAVAGMEPTLDVLGPVGRYAHDLLGRWLVAAMAGGLALWGLLAVTCAYLLFVRRDGA